MTGPQAPRHNWDLFREQFPVARKWAYFDNAAVAPLPAVAQTAIQNWLHQAVDEGDTVWPQWVRGIERARKTAAELINADVAEIAFVSNTTAGITLVAEGFPWRPGDNIVTLANEFPSNQYPWINLASRGVEVRRVALDPCHADYGKIAESIDARTRILSISWVGFASGLRWDLDRLCELAHSRGAYLFLDAIQGLGVFSLDVRQTPIDFLAADGHKWLLGAEGAGVFFLQRRHLDLLRPLGVGWNSVVQGNDYARIELNLRPTATRYEGGSQNMVGLLGLGASMELLASFGSGPSNSAIAERVLQLTDLACERLTSHGAVIASNRDGDHRSGIVSFELPGQDPQELRKRCLANHVVLSCRAGRLRISVHAYANEEDIERLIESLRM